MFGESNWNPWDDWRGHSSYIWDSGIIIIIIPWSEPVSGVVIYRDMLSGPLSSYDGSNIPRPHDSKGLFPEIISLTLWQLHSLLVSE